ncbi:hypothetical protein CEXT_555031 [Caerostris extrusa]|uniref:Uncharacterized protein n=1 Tax=Caerostris extrusa TaxID=172846 RepID=A0AAV4XTI4_CAEEX|nr:hypothetical protein CEXT_555031 [Caerostris extrusa]
MNMQFLVSAASSVNISAGNKACSIIKDPGINILGIVGDIEDHEYNSRYNFGVSRKKTDWVLTTEDFQACSFILKKKEKDTFMNCPSRFALRIKISSSFAFFKLN